MQLVQISEPDSLKREIPKIAVGIDFGTTNSLVAIVKDDEVFIIPDQDGKCIIKSLVSCESNKIICGNRADKSKSIRSIKRIVGKNFEEIRHFYQFDIVKQDSVLKVKCGNKELQPVEVIAHILGHLRDVAEKYLQQDVAHAVITVPAYFNDKERASIKDAARIVGLEVLRLVNEPTAAALAYGLQNNNNDNEIYLIYDLGGGTFDVSVLRKNKGVFQVLGTDGDVLLGGDDFDNALMELICNKCNLNKHDDKKILLSVACKIKEAFTNRDHVYESFTLGAKEYSIGVTVQEFNDVIKEYIERTIRITKSVIERSLVNLEKINSLILVGGATKLALIKERMREEFGKGKVLCDVNPDKTVVRGAAIQAHALTSSVSNSVLIDVLPLSLGVEIMGGLMDVMIERNTPLPISSSKIFTTFYDGQSVMRISVFQGEREMVKCNRLLNCFELSGITPLESGKVKIKVTFAVDVDGLLTVEAIEEDGDARKEIVVNSSYGLSSDDIGGIIKNSFEHVEEDFKNRELIETIAEGNSVVKMVERVISSDMYEFGDEQLKQLNFLIRKLRLSLNGKDVDIIKSDIESLEGCFQPIIQDKIDKRVKEVLVGNSINQYKSDCEQ